MRRINAKNRLWLISGLFCFYFIIFASCVAFAQGPYVSMAPPSNLWKGLVAEDTSGSTTVYIHLACCIKNKLESEGRTGLVALKRKNLDSFLSRELKYAKSKAGGRKDLKFMANEAIEKVFEREHPDVTNGATHYDHTGKYGHPWWAKKMVVTKVLYKGTKNEITFYREKRRKA